MLVHCRVSDPEERIKLRDQIADKVRGVTGMSCVIELVPTAQPAPNQFRQAQPGQGQAAVSFGRAPAARTGGLITLLAT